MENNYFTLDDYYLAQYVRIDKNGHIEILFLDPRDNKEHLLNADLTNVEWKQNAE